jgi:hypothetical protein
MLAKWIAKANNAKVVFDGQAEGASANVKTNEIFMPTNLKEHNILAGLALLMHEAGHLKHSKKIPPDLVKGHISRNIINVMEDVRVDDKNFGLLDNIKDFYERLVKDHVLKKKAELMKEPLMTRCLVNTILRLEGFPMVYEDKEAIEFMDNKGLMYLINEGRWAIEGNDWELVKQKIEEVKKIFGIKDEDDFEIPTITIAGLKWGDGESEQGQGQGRGKKSKDGECQGQGQDIKIDVDKYMRPGTAWDKGEGIKGPSRDILGDIAFQDMTREAFKELLNIKEKRTVYEGMKLNTDELASFFTGDIENLFVEEEIVKLKKSKIAFCLDSSGSMGTALMDGKPRTDVLVRTIRSIIDILKELQETEGLNISYDVWAFDYDAEKLNPDNWEREYSARAGGTNLLKSFLDVQSDILSNQEIDGNKMVILATDGEVGNNEIDELRNHILKHGAEVRCMVIGVGASMNGRFVKSIAGENNILGQEHADSIIMDCIRTMLE